MRLLVGEAFVAVEAVLVGFHRIGMLRADAGTLIVENHVGIRMAMFALAGIGFFEAFPDRFGQFETMLLEFFIGSDATGQMIPYFERRENFMPHRVNPVVLRHMALGAGDYDAVFVLVMLTVHIFLIDGVFHLVAGMRAEIQRIRVLNGCSIGGGKGDANEHENAREKDKTDVIPGVIDKFSKHFIFHDCYKF